MLQHIQLLIHMKTGKVDLKYILDIISERLGFKNFKKCIKIKIKTGEYNNSEY